ncbi:hypothetical protein MHC_01780 [Mycoplasma haemocanis str. Illinois]|uniref:Uncharacterized protein n=1 Tax=Mycoplasma haemocanis (strain Illinois) TaxID=1111676 RepID=H6N6F0_MYCHN|nr:hypothetical protein [Mycoplasma haemocanis]AEW45222.1 hypothetical protein MHC_01780 [Mycoplasma haemocanis str. Illinois]
MLKFFKNKYWLAASTTATATGASIISFLSKDGKREAFVSEMRKVWREEERLDEIARKRVKYPEGATDEQREYIDRIIKFERDNGLCLIFFVHKRNSGSHYRVDNSFWINEDKANPERNLFKEFVGITSSPRIANICKSAGRDKKILIRNNGSNVWDYFENDQSKLEFKNWIENPT